MQGVDVVVLVAGIRSKDCTFYLKQAFSLFWKSQQRKERMRKDYDMQGKDFAVSQAT